MIHPQEINSNGQSPFYSALIFRQHLLPPPPKMKPAKASITQWQEPCTGDLQPAAFTFRTSLSAGNLKAF